MVGRQSLRELPLSSICANIEAAPREREDAHELGGPPSYHEEGQGYQTFSEVDRSIVRRVGEETPSEARRLDGQHIQDAVNAGELFPAHRERDRANDGLLAAGNEAIRDAYDLPRPPPPPRSHRGTDRISRWAADAASHFLPHHTHNSDAGNSGTVRSASAPAHRPRSTARSNTSSRRRSGPRPDTRSETGSASTVHPMSSVTQRPANDSASRTRHRPRSEGGGGGLMSDIRRLTHRPRHSGSGGEDRDRNSGNNHGSNARSVTSSSDRPPTVIRRSSAGRNNSTSAAPSVASGRSHRTDNSRSRHRNRNEAHADGTPPSYVTGSGIGAEFRSREQALQDMREWEQRNGHPQSTVVGTATSVSTATSGSTDSSGLPPVPGTHNWGGISLPVIPEEPDGWQSSSSSSSGSRRSLVRRLAQSGVTRMRRVGAATIQETQQWLPNGHGGFRLATFTNHVLPPEYASNSHPTFTPESQHGISAYLPGVIHRHPERGYDTITRVPAREVARALRPSRRSRLARVDDLRPGEITVARR